MGRMLTHINADFASYNESIRGAGIRSSRFTNVINIADNDAGV